MLLLWLEYLGILVSWSGALPISEPRMKSGYLARKRTSPLHDHGSYSRVIASRSFNSHKLFDSRAGRVSASPVDEGVTWRDFGEIQPEWQKMLEPWIPDGIAGYIELVTSPFVNGTLADQRSAPNTGYGPPVGEYDPIATSINMTVQGIRGNQASYRIAEMGYNRAPYPGPAGVDSMGPYLMYAKSVGWGSKFWILKAHDLDCLNGGKILDSYTAGISSMFDLSSGPSNGTEYPVTLRSPFANDQYYGIYAYCTTYDPNPQGSDMRLGVAPCRHATCIPEMLDPGATSVSPPSTPTQPRVPNANPYDQGPIPDPLSGPANPDPFAPTATRNPDGTMAPTFFTTQPCNYLDPNCHVSQIFLYNPLTGTIRPIYNPAGMERYNETRIQRGRRGLSGTHLRPGSSWRRMVMLFRAGEGRLFHGWAEPDPMLVATDPAFDRRTQPQSELPKPIESPTTEEKEGSEYSPGPDSPYPLPWWRDGVETRLNSTTRKPYHCPISDSTNYSTMGSYLGPDPCAYTASEDALHATKEAWNWSRGAATASAPSFVPTKTALVSVCRPPAAVTSLGVISTITTGAIAATAAHIAGETSLGNAGAALRSTTFASLDPDSPERVTGNGY